MPSLLGRACILYQKNNFVEALKLYKKVLLVNPLAPASVRLGLALCFYRLNSPDVSGERPEARARVRALLRFDARRRRQAAKLAFERVLALDPNVAEAHAGLAVLELNSSRDDRIRTALMHVKRAYAINPNAPAVQILLAEHFFYRQQYGKAQVEAARWRPVGSICRCHASLLRIWPWRRFAIRRPAFRK